MGDSAGYTKYFPVSWEELHRNGRALAWRLMEHGPFKGVVAVTRGGLVPAAIVARELDVRHIETVCIMAYRDDKTVGEVDMIKSLKLEDNGAGWLIVDDLVDSGITARYVREMIPDAHFATLYAKPKGCPLVDTFITEVSQDTWILFPWDSGPVLRQAFDRRGERAGRPRLTRSSLYCCSLVLCDIQAKIELIR